MEIEASEIIVLPRCTTTHNMPRPCHIHPQTSASLRTPWPSDSMESYRETETARLAFEQCSDLRLFALSVTRSLLCYSLSGCRVPETGATSLSQPRKAVSLSV